MYRNGLGVDVVWKNAKNGYCYQLVMVAHKLKSTLQICLTLKCVGYNDVGLVRK